MATTPVSLPRESHGQRSLAGYSLRSHKELGTTEATEHTHTHTHTHTDRRQRAWIGQKIRATVHRSKARLSC